MKNTILKLSLLTLFLTSFSTSQVIHAEEVSSQECSSIASVERTVETTSEKESEKEQDNDVQSE